MWKWEPSSIFFSVKIWNIWSRLLGRVEGGTVHLIYGKCECSHDQSAASVDLFTKSLPDNHLFQYNKTCVLTSSYYLRNLKSHFQKGNRVLSMTTRHSSCSKSQVVWFIAEFLNMARDSGGWDEIENWDVFVVI